VAPQASSPPAASWLATAAIALLVPAMVGVMFVVTNFLFATTAASLGTSAVAASFVSLCLYVYMWFIIPIKCRPKGE
jgi:membrane protein YdbS with pleckstrin-like domain